MLLGRNSHRLQAMMQETVEPLEENLYSTLTDLNPVPGACQVSPPITTLQAICQTRRFSCTSYTNDYHNLLFVMLTAIAVLHCMHTLVHSTMCNTVIQLPRILPPPSNSGFYAVRLQSPRSQGNENANITTLFISCQHIHRGISMYVL